MTFFTLKKWLVILRLSELIKVILCFSHNISNISLFFKLFISNDNHFSKSDLMNFSSYNRLSLIKYFVSSLGKWTINQKVYLTLAFNCLLNFCLGSFSLSFCNVRLFIKNFLLTDNFFLEVTRLPHFLSYM